MQLERKVCRHRDPHNRRFFVAAGLTSQPVQLSDLEDLVHNGRRIEPAAPHILAQMIGHFLQSLESRRWCGWCCRYDTGGERERFLRIPYRR
jgi:hypothetical protein